MKTFKLILTSVFLLPTLIFAQTTYNGPAIGSVTSGAIVSTDNFSATTMENEFAGEPL